MTNLRELYLSGSGITDLGLASLGTMKGLEALEISCPKVTDAGVLKFKGLAPKLPGRARH